MDKLAFVSILKINNPNSWSGTIHSMHKVLENAYEVHDISSGYSFFRRAISHIPDNKNGHLDILKDKLLKLYDILYFRTRIQSALRHGVKIFFYPVMSDVISHIKLPDKATHIYFSDATFNLMNGYDFKYIDNTYSSIRNTHEKDTFNKADILIFASDWARNDAISFYQAHPEKTHVIPFGANIADEYKVTPKSYDHTHITCLFVGRDWIGKGLDKAIDTIRELNSMQSPYSYSLIVVGLEKPKNSVYPEYITFAGLLDKRIPDENERIISYYQNADLLILPTIAECGGIAFCEAAMFALPAFTHETGGITNTYVENGYNGVLLPIDSTALDFANAIKDSIESGKIKEYSINSRKKYEEEINWNHWLKEFTTISGSCRESQ